LVELQWKLLQVGIKIIREIVLEIASNCWYHLPLEKNEATSNHRDSHESATVIE
jgi:hypothetical protein